MPNSGAKRLKHNIVFLCETGKQMLAKVSVVTIGSDITRVAMYLEHGTILTSHIK